MYMHCRMPQLDSDDDYADDDEGKSHKKKNNKDKPISVIIDLGLSAYANSKKYKKKFIYKLKKSVCLCEYVVC